jgi:hypothetical protein
MRPRRTIDRFAGMKYEKCINLQQCMSALRNIFPTGELKILAKRSNQFTTK